MMGKFGIRDFVFVPPILRKELRTGQVWVLAADWGISWRDAKRTRNLVLPAGFHTDLMTCPLKPAGDETIPAILHDGLYVTQPGWCSRDYADEAFRALLLHCGVPKALANRMFFAVQALGFIWWDARKRVGTGVADLCVEPAQPAR